MWGGGGQKCLSTYWEIEKRRGFVQSFHAAVHLHLWFPDIVTLSFFFIIIV